MREIKFRQAIIIDGVFRRWHYWGLIDGVFVGIDTGICSPTEAIKRSCQYVELKDKNGVEIYEGDIISGECTDVVLNGLCYIAWCDVCKRLQMFVVPFGCGECNDNNLFWSDLVDDQGIIEVIGNVYSNPELVQS